MGFSLFLRCHECNLEIRLRTQATWRRNVSGKTYNVKAISLTPTGWTHSLETGWLCPTCSAIARNPRLKELLDAT